MWCTDGCVNVQESALCSLVLGLRERDRERTMLSCIFLRGDRRMTVGTAGHWQGVTRKCKSTPRMSTCMRFESLWVTVTLKTLAQKTWWTTLVVNWPPACCLFIVGAHKQLEALFSCRCARPHALHVQSVRLWTSQMTRRLPHVASPFSITTQGFRLFQIYCPDTLSLPTRVTFYTRV